jgi:hypothetical protein
MFDKRKAAKGKEKADNGRMDLRSVEGALYPRDRDPEEFRHGGNGGEDALHVGIPGGHGYRVDLDSLGEEMNKEPVKEPLARLAEDIGKLTYGDKIQFCQEVVTGKILDAGVDAMDVDKEAQDLAAKLHRWKQLRL